MTDDISLASLDVKPGSPLDALRAAASAHEDDRPARVVQAITQMVRDGADTAVLAAARSFVTRNRLLPVPTFEQAVKDGRPVTALAGDEGPGPSQATRLVNLARERYTFGVSTADDLFAVPKQGAYVARMLRSGRPSLRAELAKALFDLEGTAVNGAALADCLMTLEGEAQQQDPVDLALRVAKHDGGLVLDIGDATGRVIQITADGWETIDRSPVLFRRTAATMPLPMPERGKTLNDSLFRILNVHPDDRPLLKSVLVHFMWPDIGHAIAKLTGRDGTAKTSASKILRSLIDPCAAPTKAMPRDEKDWIVAVAASYITALDNVSDMPDWLSDAMCRASTGEGLIRRKLYTDSDVSIVSARRIVILNGIDATIKRADFARRIVQFELEKITEFRSDEEVEAEWKQVHPYALGALLDLTVKVLQRLPKTILEDNHRRLTMSSFVKIAKTVDDIESGRGLDLYTTKVSLLSGDVVDADPFAVRLIAFLERAGGVWSGLAADLVGAIPGPDPLPRSWPKDATRFGTWVRRYGRVLEAVGIEIIKGERTKAGQPYTISRKTLTPPVQTVGKTATPATQLHHDAATSGNAAAAGVAGGVAGVAGESQLHPQLHQQNAAPPAETPSGVAGVAEIPNTSHDGGEEKDSWVRDAPGDLDDPQAWGQWSPVALDSGVLADPIAETAPECRRRACHDPAEPGIAHCHKHHAEGECLR